MKTLVIFLGAAFSSVVLATTAKKFSVQTELALQGGTSTRSTIVTAEGSNAVVIQKNERGEPAVHLEVVAQRAGEQGESILMKFKIGKYENGKLGILSTPQIQTIPGEPAEIIVGDASLEGPAGELVRLKVLANPL